MKTTSINRIFVALALVLSTLPLWNASAAADPGDPPISAYAFIDLNADGQWQPGEQSFVGYQAFAYDDAGNSVAGVLNAATGQFDFNVTTLSSGSPTANRYRIEFVNPAAPYVAGVVGNGTDAALPQSGSETTFASPGDTIYWAVQDPNDYCQDNPFLATNCYVPGNNVTGPNAALETVVSLRYGWGNDGTNAPLVNALPNWQVDEAGAPALPNKVAIASEVGTTWGEAWDKKRNVLYVASYLKQLAGYGPEGPNAIYEIPMDPYTGLATGPAQLFANVGTTSATVATGGTDDVTVCEDEHGQDIVDGFSMADSVFANVGKCSFGDIDISKDGTKLYVMSLAGREVLEFDTASKTLLNQYPIMPEVIAGTFPETTATCPELDRDVRPFALGVHDDGRVFVGAVCSFEDEDVAIGGSFFGQLQTYVYTLDPATGTWAEVYALDHETKRYAIRPWSSSYANWRLKWAAPTAELGDGNRYFGDGALMLTDIEFYGDDLTLGFRDRNVDQLGAGAPDPLDPDPSDTTFIFGSGKGELLCVWWDGAAYQTEGVNECSPTRQIDPAYISATPQADGGFGPGLFDRGRFGVTADEFYWGDGDNYINSNGGHPENHWGGLSQVNVGPIAHTAINPQETLNVAYNNSGGIGWLDQTNGEADRAYIVYNENPNPGGGGFTFGKTAGLGDLEALCVEAPLEIGDYVWFDADNDGIQDPGEEPIAGATVTLYDDQGNVLATAITDAAGRYIFNSAGPDGISGNDDDYFAAGDKLVLRMDTQSDYDAGGPLEGWNVTIDSVDDGSSGTPDDQDSDAVLDDSAGVGNGRYPEIAVMAGAPGENDHSLDFGFSVIYDLALQKQLADGTNIGSVMPGDAITFTLTIINQGADVTAIELVDYFPAGLTLADANWADNGDGSASLVTPITSLAAGQETTVDIVFTVDVDAAGTLDNFAEVAGFLNPDGVEVRDIDSLADSVPGDTGPATAGDESDDNVDGCGCDGEDEDDHDVASLMVEPVEEQDPAAPETGEDPPLAGDEPVADEETPEEESGPAIAKTGSTSAIFMMLAALLVSSGAATLVLRRVRSVQ